MKCPKLGCNSYSIRVLWIGKVPDSDLSHFQGNCENCHTVVWRHDYPAASNEPWSTGSCSCPRIDEQRIMAVDDNHDWVEALLESLDILGYEARFAYDAFAALEMVAQFKPHVMLIDIEMPGMDGYELVQRVRAMVELGRPRLIAVTGMTQATDRARALEAGFDEHVAKPLDLARLESILSR